MRGKNRWAALLSAALLITGVAGHAPLTVLGGEPESGAADSFALQETQEQQDQQQQEQEPQQEQIPEASGDENDQFWGEEIEPAIGEEEIGGEDFSMDASEIEEPQSGSPQDAGSTGNGSESTGQLTDLEDARELETEAISEADDDGLDSLIEDDGEISSVFEGLDEVPQEEVLPRFDLYRVLIAYPDCPVYRQDDARWGNHPYGYYDAGGSTVATIASSGCGIMSLVNAISYLNDEFLDPTLLADWSAANGFRVNGTGTSHGLYPAFAAAYGKKYHFRSCGSVGSLEAAKDFLADKGAAIVSLATHLVAVVDYDPQQEAYLLLDSAPSARRGTLPDGYAWLKKEAFVGPLAYSGVFLIETTNAMKVGQDTGRWSLKVDELLTDLQSDPLSSTDQTCYSIGLKQLVGGLSPAETQ